MKITREIAKNCVRYLQDRGLSAYTYENNNVVTVYLSEDVFDLELSNNEIYNRHVLFLEEIEEDMEEEIE